MVSDLKGISVGTAIPGAQFVEVQTILFFPNNVLMYCNIHVIRDTYAYVS